MLARGPANCHVDSGIRGNPRAAKMLRYRFQGHPSPGFLSHRTTESLGSVDGKVGSHRYTTLTPANPALLVLRAWFEARATLGFSEFFSLLRGPMGPAPAPNAAQTPLLEFTV